MGETMADLRTLSDVELREKLIEYGIADGPVTKTTREVFIRRLTSVMEAGNRSTHEETAESRPSSVRRRSAAKPGKTPRQRTSILPTIPIDSKTDESDGCENEKPEKKTPSRLNPAKSNRKSVNGKTPTIANHVPDVISDEDLFTQLAKFNIPCPTVTIANKPILIKKLNHASAKSRRESKIISPPKYFKTAEVEADVEQESDEDIPDNANFVTGKERKTLTPMLSYSQLHSLTLGSRTCSPLNESFLKMSPPIPTSNIVNRFVEEQEPYDTGSDSEAENMASRAALQRKSWGFSSLYPGRLFSPKVYAIKYD